MSTYEFSLPDVGEGLSEGEIVAWHVAEGDRVKVDQIIVDVQTDKAIVEIPAPVAGRIVRLGGGPGDVLPIGAVLAVFETDGGPSMASDHEPAAPPAVIPDASAAPVPAGGPLPVEPLPVKPVVVGTGPGRAKASPATRKLARSLGIDLATLSPSGTRGQVTRADVEAAHAAGGAGAAPDAVQAPPVQPGSQGAPITPAEAFSARAEGDNAPGDQAASDKAPGAAGAISAPRGAGEPLAPHEDRVEPLRGLRRQIARTMDLAWRSVPHIFSMDDLDATALVAARRSLNDDLAGEGIKLSFLPFFIKACAASLRAHPRFNASLDLEAEQVLFHARVNVGIATSTPDGLIVTVVHDADRRSLVDVALEVERLAGLARARRIAVAQLSGATFSISNYGSYGAHMGTPIIRPPECAIAGFGRIADAVVPVAGVPAVMPRLPFCISADHRLNDGEDLGAFVTTMRRYLLDPIRLLGLR